MRLLLAASLLLAAPLHAGEIKSRCVVTKYYGCDTDGSGGGGGGGSSDPVSIEWGGMTARGIRNNAERCGRNPFCQVMGVTAALLVGGIFDLPYYAVKVPFLIIKGAGKGVGKVVSAPFKASKAKTQRLAYNAAPGCSGAAAADGSFDAYRSWEDCKRAVLKRQRALTKLDPSNKANEDWCKTRIPLNFGPNRQAWEERCNGGGGAVLVPDPNAPSAEPAPAEPQAAPPAAQGGIKVGSSPTLDTLKGLAGETGADFDGKKSP